MNDAPVAQAHALAERLFALLVDCRADVQRLEPGSDAHAGQSEGGRAAPVRRAGRRHRGRAVRTAEDVLTVLKQASQPPMGAEWLQAQEQQIDGGEPP